jgi:hypothetical protein
MITTHNYQIMSSYDTIFDYSYTILTEDGSSVKASVPYPAFYISKQAIFEALGGLNIDEEYVECDSKSMMLFYNSEHDQHTHKLNVEATALLAKTNIQVYGNAVLINYLLTEPGGAVVRMPRFPEYHEPVCVIDFSSLYPSIMMNIPRQINIKSCL